MDIENLAFSGGGIKALAFNGAIRMLEKANIMPGIKRIVATSAGALLGIFLVCGFSANEIIEIVTERDFKHLKDNSNLMENVHRFIFYYGFYSGELIDSWIAENFELKGINPEITFKEVYEQFNKDFIVTGTHLNKREIVYFNKDNTPDMPVKTAVRISISIPLFFEPIELNGDIYVDGALLGNYPIGYLERIDPQLKKTIGFYAVSKTDKTRRRDIHDVFHVIDLVMNTLTNKIDMDKMTELQKTRTVIIDTKNINSTDFHIDKEMKERLFGRGYRSTKRFIESNLKLKKD